ncbi:MAG: DUF4430 domain-containing protein [Clostridiales bacterium]|nr:DUF4430 domain-containing protein [Clostridiales bacterium]
MKTRNYRILSLLTALMLSLALLSGCGGSSADASQSSGSAASSVATEDASASSATAEESAAPAESSAAEAESSTADAETKHITLTVTYADGSSDNYEIDTEADYLKDAIDATVELGGEESDYGFYITSVNGVEADYDADGAYWAIYVNDTYGSYGVDSQPVADGDSFALVYEVY